ncbi:13056_t:CDS:2, partial [Dentiscutata erythropus]
NRYLSQRLRKSNKDYIKIANRFKDNWKHSRKLVPKISNIWEIHCNWALKSKYRKYRKMIENKRCLKGNYYLKDDRRKYHMASGNEQLRSWSCFIGLKDDGKVCKNKLCSVCGIIRNGYKLKFVSTGRGTSRFGKGIYFSRTSSKCDDYNGSPKYFKRIGYKVMIVNSVVIGKGYKIAADDTTLTSPPYGFDSILGEPSKNRKLKYDELAIYREEAIRPQYLIVYVA